MVRPFTLAVGYETLGVGLNVQREGGKRKGVPGGRHNVVLVAQDVATELQDVGTKWQCVGAPRTTRGLGSAMGVSRRDGRGSRYEAGADLHGQRVA